VKESLIKTHSKNLQSKGFLPLNSNNTQLHIIARMYGFVFTDGSIFIHKTEKSPRLEADFGTYDSALEFEEDVEKLDFASTKIVYGTRRQITPDKREITHSTYTVQHQTAFVSLLICLGFQPGKKITQKYKPIPSWLHNSSDLVKREF